jgi:hypothetical protein
MRGYVYILSNDAMPKLFKIGYTTRLVSERIRELSGTGVPGKFIVEFYAEIEDAYNLEKVVHNRLSRQRYDKEFFRCELSTAVRVVKTSIIENGYDILSHGGKGYSAFLTEVEIREINVAADEQRKRQIARESAERQRQISETIEKQKYIQRVAEIDRKFVAIATIVDKIIDSKYNIVYKYETARDWLGLAAMLTIVGMPIARKLCPNPFEIGKKIAKKLSNDEIDLIRKFRDVVKEVQELNVFFKVADAYLDRNTSDQSMRRMFSRWSKYEIVLSEYLLGVLTGLGIEVRGPYTNGPWF